jgi:hypothetical protein
MDRSMYWYCDQRTVQIGHKKLHINFISTLPYPTLPFVKLKNSIRNPLNFIYLFPFAAAKGMCIIYIITNLNYSYALRQCDILCKNGIGNIKGLGNINCIFWNHLSYFHSNFKEQKNVGHKKKRTNWFNAPKPSWAA